VRESFSKGEVVIGLRLHENTLSDISLIIRTLWRLRLYLPIVEWLHFGLDLKLLNPGVKSCKRYNNLVYCLHGLRRHLYYICFRN
jgi:hypothetical protein